MYVTLLKVTLHGSLLVVPVCDDVSNYLGPSVDGAEDVVFRAVLRDDDVAHLAFLPFESDCDDVDEVKVWVVFA